MTDIYPVKSLRTLALLWVAVLLVFHDYPSIDINVTRLFFDASACGSNIIQSGCGTFPLAHLYFFSALRTVLFYLPALLAVLLAVSIFSPDMNRWFDWPEASRRNRIILLGVWIVDVGIIVNALLKQFSGRPRPEDSLIFGGQLPFVPAGDLSGACTGNCSFISGEAASAGWILCLVALLPPPWRQRLFVPMLALSLGTALLRVAFGRHYLSDALLAWLSALCIFALAATVFGWRKRKINT